jgi:hypothetical protein
MPLVPRRPRTRAGHLPPGRAAGAQTRRAGGPTSHRPLARIAPWAGTIWLLAWSWAGLSGSNTIGGIAVGALGFAGGIAVRGAARRAVAETKAAHYSISAPAQELRRGDAVEVVLRLDTSRELGEVLGVGLVCTESYDYVTRDAEGKRGARSTARDDVFEAWYPADRSRPEQSFAFQLPADGPFSYEGSCLSFAWRLIAREQAAGRIDTHHELPLWVEP